MSEDEFKNTMTTPPLDGINNIEGGQYLLFLNVYDCKTVNKKYLVIDSNNHLYKKSLIGYRNIFGPNLSNIGDSEVEGFIDKLKNK